MIIIDEVFIKANYYGLDYMIGNCGAIIGPKRGAIKQRVNEDGYAVVTLGKLTNRHAGKPVHRLVAEQFVENPNPDCYLEVNHKDFDRLNNKAENLEWVTHKKNIEYSVNAGHYNGCNGESNGRAKMTRADADAIRCSYAAGMRIADIAKKFNKPWSTIGNIVHNKTWTY